MAMKMAINKETYNELDPRTLNERMAVQLIALFGFGGLFMVGLVIKVALLAA